MKRRARGEVQFDGSPIALPSGRLVNAHCGPCKVGVSGDQAATARWFLEHLGKAQVVRKIQSASTLVVQAPPHVVTFHVVAEIVGGPPAPDGADLVR